MVSPRQLSYLRQAVGLATTSLRAGDPPFGAVLVDAQGSVLLGERAYRGDPIGHPDFALARWAAQRLTKPQRATATVYTSSEPCPMCSAAHAWAGLGSIVYATSAARVASWREEYSVPADPVRPLPITDIAPGLDVTGPVAEFTDEVRDLLRRYHRG